MHVSKFDAVVFDLDGVVWKSYQPIANSVTVINTLLARGLKIAFLTNTSSKTPSFLHRKLVGLGIEVPEHLVFTSSRITAEYLFSTYGENTLVVAHGQNNALLSEMQRVGLLSVSLHEIDSTKPHLQDIIIVLGFDDNFGIYEVEKLLNLSSKVIKLYASERDRWYSSQKGLRPGAGWVVAAAEEVLNKKATVLGKPSPIPLNTIARLLNVKTTGILMVGDSIESDITAAKNSHSHSCLFTPKQHHLLNKEASKPADYLITDLEELLDII